MNRRTFLRSVLAVPAAALMGKGGASLPPPYSWDLVHRGRSYDWDNHALHEKLHRHAVHYNMGDKYLRVLHLGVDGVRRKVVV